MLKASALKAQDVLVACKLHSLSESATHWTYVSLSDEVGLSTGEIHNACERCRAAQLLVTVREREVVSKKHMYDLLVFAVPRIFYAVRGGLEKGMPTAVHALPLSGKFELIKGSLPVVWSCEQGDVRGEEISPIYPSVPEAARRDPLLYELLALVDVMRIGDTRARNIASGLLEKRFLKSSD